MKTALPGTENAAVLAQERLQRLCALASFDSATSPLAPPLIVAELSGNHMGSYEIARALVTAAAEAGADAIKLQTYSADGMTLPLNSGDFRISDPTSLWHGHSLYELYRQAATPREWHAPLFAYARSLGLLAFSSPFDADAADFLATLDVPCYKIASFELTDLGLIRHVAAKRKPLILSTGMASLAEIEEAVGVAREAGTTSLMVLKCSSHYPAEAAHANLLTMAHMATTFHCRVGYSDHTRGLGCAVAAVAMGASMIEKHLVLDTASAAVDAGFSADPQTLGELVQACREAWEARGRVQYGGSVEDRAERRYRRSLYVAKDIKKGERLSAESLRVVRPGLGLPPKYLELLLGKRVTDDIRAGTALAWHHVLVS